MPSRATRAVGTRRATCVSCTDGAIIGITNGWDTKQQRLEPDAEQSARPVLRGAPDSNAAAPTRLRLWQDGFCGALWWRRGPPGNPPQAARRMAGAAARD